MWVSAVVVFVFFFIAAKRMKKEPEGLQTFAEILLNFATGHLTGQIGEKGKKYYYLILTLFTYIIVTNLIGLIPKPDAAQALHAHGQHQRDVRHGHRGVLRHPVPGLQAPRLPQATWGRGSTPPGVPKALGRPLNVIFFPVHFMGEFFKPLSLSVRLFGNTIAGHLIILVMLGLLLQYGIAHHRPGRRCSCHHDCCSRCSSPSSRRTSSRCFPSCTSNRRSTPATNQGTPGSRRTR